MMDARTVIVIVVHAILFVVGCRLIVIDMRSHRLPNRIVLPTLAGILVLVLIDSLVTGRTEAAVRGVMGMLALGGFYALLRLVSRDGMGGGDVKLAAVIGLVLAWHGWSSLVVGAAAAFVLGALFAAALVIARRADGSTRIAFGPWMIIGSVIGILVA